MANDRLESLIRRIRRLPDDVVPDLESCIARLENGTSAERPLDKIVHPNHNHWPHAPVHQISEHGTFIVTAGTFLKRHFFREEARLDLLESKLLELAGKHGWNLEAWAVFSNHYHFVAHSQADSTSLKQFLGELHGTTALEANRRDGASDRQVWHNYWETRLTFERSYLVRLNYVHHNAVRHGLVPIANQYRWCSAAWFERTASPAQVKTIYSFKTDRVNVIDDF